MEIERDFERALQQSQVVIMLRIQARGLAGLHLDLEQYKSRYQANAERMAAHAPDALLLHPGPIIRGLELTSEVADGPQSAIEEQVHHGVAIRMALLARALQPNNRERKAGMSAILMRGGRLVDPAAGIDARTRRIVARRRKVAAVDAPGKLKAAAKQEEAETIDATGMVVASRAGRYPRSSARARPGLQGDHRQRNGSGGGRWIHQRVRHAEYHAGQRLA